METNIRFIGFDLDHTLIAPKSGGTFRKDANDWDFMPRRVEKYKSLHAQGIMLAVITNQAGPPWREVTGDRKFPSTVEIATAIKDIAMQLTIHGADACDPWYISLYDQRAVDLIEQKIQREILAASDIAGSPADRGLSPIYEEAADLFKRIQIEMQKELASINAWVGVDPEWRKPKPGMLNAAFRMASVMPDEALYVGDREDDEAAAKAIGCHFQYAEKFFAIA